MGCLRLRAVLPLAVTLATLVQHGSSSSNNAVQGSGGVVAPPQPQRQWDASQCETQSFASRVAEVRRGPTRRVLVTGAAGFIGSHVAEFTARRLNWETVAVDDLSGGFRRNLRFGNVTNASLVFVQVDLKDAAAVAALFTEHGPFDYVYHLAAYAAEGLSHFIRRFNYRNNLEASVSIINQAVIAHTKALVFTSSIAAFGVPDRLPIIEETLPHPEDPYGISKLAVEMDLKAAHDMFGLDFIIFRPHNVYGPRQNTADKFRNAIGIFMNQVMNNEPMTLFGDGSQTRGFSYIDDVAPLIAMSPETRRARQQAFFVGSDKEYSVLDLSHEVAKAMGVPHRVQHLDARREVAYAYADHSKLRCFFNPPTPVPLDEGLKWTAEYAKAIGKVKPTGFSDIEVWDKMPASWVRALQDWGERRPNRTIKARAASGTRGVFRAAAAAAAQRTTPRDASSEQRGGKLRVVLLLFGVAQRSIRVTWPALKARVLDVLREQQMEVYIALLGMQVGDAVVDGCPTRASDMELVPYDHYEPISQKAADAYIDEHCGPPMLLKCPLLMQQKGSLEFRRNGLRQLYVESAAGRYLDRVGAKFDAAIAVVPDYFALDNISTAAVREAAVRRDVVFASNACPAGGISNGFYVGHPTAVAKVMRRGDPYFHGKLQVRTGSGYEKTLGAGFQYHGIQPKLLDWFFVKIRSNALVANSSSFPCLCRASGNTRKGLSQEGIQWLDDVLVRIWTGMRPAAVASTCVSALPPERFKGWTLPDAPYQRYDMRSNKRPLLHALTCRAGFVKYLAHVHEALRLSPGQLQERGGAFGSDGNTTKGAVTTRGRGGHNK